MTPKQTIQLIKEAKEMGLPEIRIGDIYVKFDQPKAAAQPVPELKPEDIVKPMSVLDELSPEEIQYYATPYYDELKRLKDLRAQTLKEEPNGKD